MLERKKRDAGSWGVSSVIGSGSGLTSVSGSTRTLFCLTEGPDAEGRLVIVGLIGLASSDKLSLVRFGDVIGAVESGTEGLRGRLGLARVAFAAVVLELLEDCIAGTLPAAVRCFLL